jgi:ERCC4-type nuclease
LRGEPRGTTDYGYKGDNIKILVDSREQTALEFNYDIVSEVRIEKLPVGDYQVEYEDNFRPPIIFERKSLSDLYGTLGKGHKRFKNEIALSKQLGIQLILIVEKPLSTVLKGYEKSDLSGDNIVKKMFTLMIKYNLFLVFCKDREECAEYIYNFFSAIGRLKMKQSKQIGTTNAKLSSVSGSGNIQAGGE